ncbi:MAG: serine hydrolase [Chloroflexota bacterium]
MNQVQQHPQDQWLQYARLEDAGYDSRRLSDAQAHFERVNSAAVMIIDNGAVLAAWGDISRRFRCHSVRKSLMSALFGIYVDRGVIDLGKTLGELGINDSTPLTTQEQQATIADLLKSRSGIYLPAAYETEQARKLRPQRESHAPGTHWYYNNWDFNALLTIFEQETGKPFIDAFDEEIAKPLQMEEFRPHDTYHHYERNHSEHPAYPLRMSAKDMARFGLLFLRNGLWCDDGVTHKQVLSARWIEESTRCYSGAEDMFGYGYLWWTVQAQLLNGRLQQLGAYVAQGVGTQLLMVIPGANLVIVHRANTYEKINVNGPQILAGIEMILDAKRDDIAPVQEPSLTPLRNPDPAITPVKLDSVTLDAYTGDYRLDDGRIIQIARRYDSTPTDLMLTILNPQRLQPTYLLPLSQTHFRLEDVGSDVIFELDTDGQSVGVRLVRDKIEYAPRL